MQEYGVLDDCKSQPCPSESPGTSLVHPVESLEEMYEMFLGDTFPVVIEYEMMMPAVGTPAWIFRRALRCTILSRDNR